MNILWIIIIAAAALILAGRFYAPLIARALGEKADRPTPAVTINDGRDYVPTKTSVVFAHHFASIAGAGPIIGPVLALIYGWGPALIWIILGGIFLGAVHDFTATHVALREGGKSITVTARRYIGRGAFFMLLILLVAILALVCAAFLDLSATALTSKVALDDLQLNQDQNIFRMEEGKAVIGGIASMSVIMITICSPLVGFLYIKRKWPVWTCSLLAMIICALSIYIGFVWPVKIEPDNWKLLISAYVLISAGLPVWLFLQSRDFINVHLLYVGIIFMFIALIAAGLRGGGQFNTEASIPFNNWTQGSQVFGLAWPIMFITIACGAVSGFHSLCAGGTTCKQLSTEVGARRVGYYGMLLESFLSVCVVCCLLVGLAMAGSKGYMFYCHPQGVKGNAILTFAVGVGHTVHTGLGLPVWVGLIGAMLILEGFLVTTLDTAIRLTRYLIEEGWSTFFSRYDVFASEGYTLQQVQETAHLKDKKITGTGGMSLDATSTTKPSGLRALPTTGLLRGLLLFIKQYWVNSGLAVCLMLLLGWGDGLYKQLWKIFGASNQLLAALALIICTVWMLKRNRPIRYIILPAIFMLITAVAALVYALVYDFIPSQNTKLILTSVIVLILTAGIVIATIRSLTQKEKQTSLIAADSR